MNVENKYRLLIDAMTVAERVRRAEALLRWPRYHLTGGIASVAYGEPRMTQDVDLVLDRDRVLAVEVGFPGVELPIASRADAALSRLIWIRHGSHRNRRDLRGLLAGATRDELSAVERAAGEMGLADLLAEVLDEPDEIGV
jgi:hypothetical protein